MRGVVVVGVVLGAFVLGQRSVSGGGLLQAGETGPALELPQERGTVPTTPNSGGSNPSAPTTAEPLVWGGDTGQGGSANGFIAVTGSYGVGTSVLYVLDTENRQLAVYEARGGSPGGRRLLLVGARRIDLDLQLEGYNDESEFSYRELEQRFQRATNGRATVDDNGANSETFRQAPGTDAGNRGK
jgi:hypothetical protein